MAICKYIGEDDEMDSSIDLPRLRDIKDRYQVVLASLKASLES